MLRFTFVILTFFLLNLSTAVHSDSAADRGAGTYRQCAACHSLDTGVHLTGPSLAGLLGREAGTAKGFGRYSEALRRSGLIWNEKTLDKWVENPTGLVAGTSMRIQGIKDKSARQDLITFLKQSSERRSSNTADATQDQGMMSGMTGGQTLNLKNLSLSQQVTNIRYCGDAYYVSLGTGKTYTFWEFNLRLKTDSSKYGPQKGSPAIVKSGMRGDRASIVFSEPIEISGFIKQQC
jgi:cytochrome c